MLPNRQVHPLYEGRINLPAADRYHLLHCLQGAKGHPVLQSYHRLTVPPSPAYAAAPAYPGHFFSCYAPDKSCTAPLRANSSTSDPVARWRRPASCGPSADSAGDWSREAVRGRWSESAWSPQGQHVLQPRFALEASDCDPLNPTPFLLFFHLPIGQAVGPAQDGTPRPTAGALRRSRIPTSKVFSDG